MIDLIVIAMVMSEITGAQSRGAERRMTVGDVATAIARAATPSADQIAK
jgi:hypothetical protein